MHLSKKLIWLLIFFGILKIFIHVFSGKNYGLHADELYYIALSDHLQWGYIDNAPFIAFITKVSSLFFGESTIAYRLFPILFSGVTVSLTGYIAFRLGGKSLAISISCLAMIFSPAYLATSYLLQPVVFEQFFWTAGALLLLLYFQTENRICLYSFSAVLAFGFLNKYTILLFILSVALALLLTRNLRHFKWRDLIISLLIFLAIITPNLFWQAKHGFPIVIYLGIVDTESQFPGFGSYIFQFMFLHAAGVAVWFAGLLLLILSKAHRAYVFFALAFLINFALLLLLKGKIYYSLCAFTFLFAAGGVCWEIMLKRIRTAWKIPFYAMLVVPSLVALPVVVPILPFGVTIQYLKLMRQHSEIDEPLTWEDGVIHAIPQTYADMLGWKELSKKVEDVYLQIPASKRSSTIILTDKYYLAGALTHYLNAGKHQVVSINNSFVLWSPPTLNSEHVIYISVNADKDIADYATKVELTDSVNLKYARINGAKIYVLTKPTPLFKKMYADQRARTLGNKSSLKFCKID